MNDGEGVLQVIITGGVHDIDDTEVTEGEQARVWSRGASSPESLDLVVQGYTNLMKDNKEDNIRAREQWHKCSDIDPDYAVPWMGMGWSHFRDSAFGWTDDMSTLTKQRLDRE